MLDLGVQRQQMLFLLPSEMSPISWGLATSTETEPFGDFRSQPQAGLLHGVPWIPRATSGPSIKLTLALSQVIPECELLWGLGLQREQGGRGSS